MKLIKIAAITGAAFGLAACGSIPGNTTPDGKVLLTEMGAPATPLEPMQVPAADRVGDKYVFYRKGEEMSAEIITVDAEAVTTLMSNGCQYTDAVSANNLSDFGPSLAWENCRGSAGHAKVKVEGEIFPLETGKEVVYTVKGTTTSGSWTGDWSNRRVCKVSDQVHIQTLSGEYDTWKIQCKQKKENRTYYVSPELGHIVAMIRKHSEDRARMYTSVFLREG